MTPNEKHAAMVRRLKKNPGEIRAELTDRQVDLMHMALGLAGESGEVVDLIKKSVVNGHPLDAEKMVEELGDVLFYIQGLAIALGVSLDSIQAYNVDKLTRRYKDGYSDQASIDRVDTEHIDFLRGMARSGGDE